MVLIYHFVPNSSKCMSLCARVCAGVHIACTYFTIKRFDKVSAKKDKAVQFLCLTSSCCNDPPVTGPDGKFCRWNMCMSDVAV